MVRLARRCGGVVVRGQREVRVHVDIGEVRACGDKLRRDHHVVEDLRIPAVQAGAVIAVDIPEPITGLWDRLSVEQVLDNLLSNAIKYGAGSPITVSAWVDGTEAHMMVADGGPGLAEAEQARIFEQFERGQGTGRRTGFGVGLWIVRELASAMGGDVALRSAPGQGTSAIFSLPVSQTSVALAAIAR